MELELTLEDRSNRPRRNRSPLMGRQEDTASALTRRRTTGTLPLAPSGNETTRFPFESPLAWSFDNERGCVARAILLLLLLLLLLFKKIN
jgi:hypothetical protein